MNNDDLIERLDAFFYSDAREKQKLIQDLKIALSPVSPEDVQGKIQRYKDMAETGHVAQAFDGAFTLIERLARTVEQQKKIIGVLRDE